MTEPADAAAAATALVVCNDALACKLIVDSLRPLAIRAEICEEVFAAARLLDKQKFEAVIVDLLLGEGAMLVMLAPLISSAARIISSEVSTVTEPCSLSMSSQSKPR